MPSASELRAELKALRKSHPEHAPISKMKKSDISDVIQKMKLRLEETPPVASVASAPAKVYKSAVESVKDAKREEFPLEIHAEAHKHSKKAPKKAEVPEMMMKEEAKAPKHAKKAPKKATKKASKKAPKAEVPEMMMKEEAKAPEKKGRPAKGSEEAKAHMAKIRMMKKKE